jgi:hypothetical protein
MWETATIWDCCWFLRRDYQTSHKERSRKIIALSIFK